MPDPTHQTDQLDQAELAARFLQLHRPGQPLLMPNAWDIGSARLLASLGFEALATTSGGFAASRGRLDGSMGVLEVIDHIEELAAATNLPLSADLENGFAHDPDEMVLNVQDAIDAGVAGLSIEDFTGDPDDPIYEPDLAADRVAAAVESAHNELVHVVVTARCENYLHGRPDLDDTIRRLQAYEVAGADVLFAPRVDDPDDLRRLIDSVDLPVSVLAGPNTPPVSVLAEMGVSRISVGGAFAVAAYGAMVAAATELRQQGTYGYWDLTKLGGRAIKDAF
jgi:2-methylisocitrate lyase-like PEP mutase family enzyme